MGTPLEWLIVGGGIHGVHLAIALLRGAGIPPERLGILDPHARLLQHWNCCTANTGMTTLRSPGVHHLDLDPKALFTFAKTSLGRQHPAPKGAFGRPSLALFAAQNDALITECRLEKRHIIDRASGIEHRGKLWRVETAAGSLDAANVALAIGASEQPHWPAWAAALRSCGARIQHIFEPGFERGTLQPWQHIVVVGGGISAAQTALTLAQQTPGSVTLLQRRPTQLATFDSDPCWMGPKCQSGFQRERDLCRRREIIRAARYRGSVPDYVNVHVRRAIAQGHLTQQIDEVAATQLEASGMILLELASGASLTTDCILLATGFEQCRPGGAWLDQAIRRHALPLAPCSYPIVDSALCWAPGLFVSGPLAELEIGPVARNIIGARMAAWRLVEAARSAYHETRTRTG